MSNPCFAGDRVFPDYCCHSICRGHAVWKMAAGLFSSQLSSSSFPLPSCALSWCPATRELHRLLHHGLCDNRAGNRLLRNSASHGETADLVGKGLGTLDLCTSQHKNRGPLAASTSCVRAGSPVLPEHSGILPTTDTQVYLGYLSPWLSRKASISDIIGRNTLPILPISAVTRPLPAFFQHA